MRSLTFTAHQFDTFVYPQVATSNATNDAEFETAVRLMKKLKDPALTSEIPYTDEELKGARPGFALFAFRKLNESRATFMLEDDEWALLRDRIDAHRFKVPLVSIEAHAELLASIGDAPAAEVSTVE